jgi:ubiquinone biosynthesis protein UbiJ
MSSQDRLLLSALGVFRPLVGAAVNQILRADPQILKRLAPLEGKLLAVEITELPCFFLWVNKGQVQLLWETSERPDGTIRTGLFATAHTKTRRDDHLFHDSLTYEFLGDPDTAQAVRIFFSRFEPDWEERLAGFVGDTMARQAGQGVRVAAEWTRNARRSAMQNFSEYLQEERQVLATRPQVERQFDEMARLQRGVDALERRLTLLYCLAG